MNRCDGEFPFARVLITGGAGFIGSHVVPRMLASGAHVAVIDNLSFGHADLLPQDTSRLQFYQVDIRDRAAMATVFQEFRPEAVIHLAAIHFIPYCNQHPVEAADVNIMGTDGVLAICEEMQPQLVFVASTAAVYPIREGANREDMPTGPTDIYGISKLTNEWQAELFQRRTGIPTVVGRFFNAYGPNETNPHVIPEIIRQLREGKRRLMLGNIEPKRDFIHTSDLARAIDMLVRCHENGFDVFNIGTGREVSVAEIVAICENILGERITIVPDPARIRKAERMHLLADNHKLRQLTGWQPQVDLRDGLAALLTGP